jgi:hypothetical protein
MPDILIEQEGIALMKQSHVLARPTIRTCLKGMLMMIIAQPSQVIVGAHVRPRTNRRGTHPWGRILKGHEHCVRMQKGARIQQAGTKEIRIRVNACVLVKIKKKQRVRRPSSCYTTQV